MYVLGLALSIKLIVRPRLGWPTVTTACRSVNCGLFSENNFHRLKKNTCLYAGVKVL
jgi:hypothetical protein